MLNRIVVIPVILLIATAALAQEAAKTATVAKKPMVVTISAKGTIQPASAETTRLKVYDYRGRFVVAEVVEPGTHVKAGDVVLRFEQEALLQAVDNARFELGLAEEDLRIRLEKYGLQEKSEAMELTRRELELQTSQRRLGDWLTYDKPRSDAYSALDRTQQDFTVENAKEELRQLELMYGEDELVDETEEIVLERSRHNLRRRVALRDLWIQNRKRNLEVTQKRHHEQLTQDLERKQHTLAKVRKEAEHAAEGRLMGEMRSRRSFEKQKTSFTRLEALLSGAVVKAPRDGVLLHGPLTGALARRFVAGTTVNVAEGIISVADPASLVAVLSVPAKEKLRLVGLGVVELTPDLTGAAMFKAKVDSVSALPRGGNFEIRCSLPAETSPAFLGAALKAKILLTESEDVLSVPSNCILSSGALAFCRVEGKDGLVAVKTGRTDGKRTEILEGLTEGDKVLLPPEAQKK